MKAITRPISNSFASATTTHHPPTPIDLTQAKHQHQTYTHLLERTGCTLLPLPPEHDHPDAVFVEDTAVVLEDVAIITRPGHPPRRQETASVEAVLENHRPIERLTAPATLDGGDVLRVGATLYVGLTRRTNEAGVEQLRALAAPHGFAVTPVAVRGCLHLKSACTQIGPERVIVNREWVDADALLGLDLIDVEPSEPWAANQLLVGETLISPTAPRTASKLRGLGLTVETVDTSEIAKADGGVTCCSILLLEGS